jgi:hypothetical protein
MVTNEPVRVGSTEVPPKRWFLSIKLHAVTFQKIVVFVFTAFSSVNLKIKHFYENTD